MKVYKTAEVQLHSLLTLALYGGEQKWRKRVKNHAASRKYFQLDISDIRMYASTDGGHTN